MKKGRAVSLDLRLSKEMKKPRFAAAFQKELGRLRLADTIAGLREKHGWTQAELARRVGTTQSGIARLENPNYQNYSLKTLEKVAKALGVRLVVGLEEIGRRAA
ncbi:MAG: helix-turn-helix domain-containing protein [Candidatus Binatia bacterium]